jgi:PTS system mannose-specific IIB component
VKHLPAVVLFRIDERLIHGQVVTAWVGHTKARQILVIDDNAAADSLMSSILKMAAPPGITVTVASVGEGRRLLAGAGEDDNTIVIMKNPQEAARLLIAARPALPPEVNMGNAAWPPAAAN